MIHSLQLQPHHSGFSKVFVHASLLLLAADAWLASADNAIGAASAEAPAATPSDAGVISEEQINLCGTSFETATEQCFHCPEGFDSQCPPGWRCYSLFPYCENELPVQDVFPGKINRCGTNAFDVETTCVKCPGGQNSECPAGMSCFAGYPNCADGLPLEVAPAPTITPPPTAQPGTTRAATQPAAQSKAPTQSKVWYNKSSSQVAMGASAAAVVALLVAATVAAWLKRRRVRAAKCKAYEPSDGKDDVISAIDDELEGGGTPEPRKSTVGSSRVFYPDGDDVNPTSPSSQRNVLNNIAVQNDIVARRTNLNPSYNLDGSLAPNSNSTANGSNLNMQESTSRPSRHYPGSLNVHSLPQMSVHSELETGLEGSSNEGRSEIRAAVERLTPGWSHEISDSCHKRLTDQSICTTAPSSMVVLPKPGSGADSGQIAAFVHNQLDRIALGLSNGRPFPILYGLVLQGCGPRDRLQGGQAIVQMAHRLGAIHDNFAIKFFLSRTAFHNEASQYQRDNPVRSFLPQVRNVELNEKGMHVDPAGHALPPCVVMERGESLDIWSERNAPDPSQSFSVMYQLAERLIELHAAGIVHRDLKPANVMWLPSQNRWTVIDFGCAAKAGSNERLAFTMRYAAPEVIAAHRGRPAPALPAAGAATTAAASVSAATAANAPVAASAAATAAAAACGGTAGSVTGAVTTADTAGSKGSSARVDFYVTSSSASHVFGFTDGSDHLLKDAPATAGSEGGSSDVEGGKPNGSNPTSNGAESSEPSPSGAGGQRQSGGQRRVVVAESLDAWSLGVMAFELATGEPGCAFPRGMTSDEIMDEIEGVNGAELPWEGSRLTETVRKQLQLFQGSILRLLDRDPSKRPSMREFHRICRSILGDVSTVQSDSLP